MAKRAARRRRREAAPPPTRSRTPWVLGGLAVAALLVVGVGLILGSGGGEPAGPIGQQVELQPALHILPGEDHPAYNSDPPTSGWHYPQPASAGVYDTPIGDEFLVHSLEHGYVIMSYDCGAVPGSDCERMVADLSALFDRLVGWKIIVVPRPDMGSLLVLTAWGWIDRLDSYDEDRILAFVRSHRNQGPERTRD